MYMYLKFKTAFHYLNLGCSDAILSSDHRPVFSSFNVGITSEFIQNRCSLAGMSAVKIIFHSIEAQVGFYTEQCSLMGKKYVVW